MTVHYFAGLHGQKLKNCPMIIQPTHAEKNRAAMAAAAAGQIQKGPMRLYVGSLHFNITEDMLKDIFEPFGKIDSLQLMMDPETNRSRGYAFITFRDVENAKRAMEQLNGN
jgi:RNA-binding protein 39